MQCRHYLQFSCHRSMLWLNFCFESHCESPALCRHMCWAQEPESFPMSSSNHLQRQKHCTRHLIESTASTGQRMTDGLRVQAACACDACAWDLIPLARWMFHEKAIKHPLARKDHPFPNSAFLSHSLAQTKDEAPNKNGSLRLSCTESSHCRSDPAVFCLTRRPSQTCTPLKCVHPGYTVTGFNGFFVWPHGALCELVGCGQATRLHMAVSPLHGIEHLPRKGGSAKDLWRMGMKAT